MYKIIYTHYKHYLLSFALSILSGKNTLVITISPVLKVWHCTSVRGLLVFEEFAPKVCDGEVWGDKTSWAWHWQWQQLPTASWEGLSEDEGEDEIVAADNISSNLWILSNLSIVPLLRTWSTIAILWAKEGEEPSPLGDETPPDPLEPAEPTLLKLGYSVSST